MTIRLPTPDQEYTPETERRRNDLIERELDKKWGRQQDIQTDADSRIILTSPDGTRYELTVADGGAISSEPI